MSNNAEYIASLLDCIEAELDEIISGIPESGVNSKIYINEIMQRLKTPFPFSKHNKIKL
mgnify:CR=1 FL=1